MATDVHSVHVPRAPAIPGLRFRQYRGPVDHVGMAPVVTAARRASGMLQAATAESLDALYGHLSNCDPARDIVVVELDGSIVAYGRTWWADRTTGERAFEAICFVHPDVAGRGIGRALLAQQDRSREELHAAMAAELGSRRAIATAYLRGDDPGGRHILEEAGYRLARRHCEMARPSLDDIPAVPVPDGLEIRPIDPADRTMLRRVFDVSVEVFQDHWGDVDASPEAFAAFVEAPETQPALWCVAFAGDEIAGHILNFLEDPEPDGARTGWTESIAVRRPWRRRGLARAMLALSLRTVRDAGATRAALGVDTENPNQAFRLYESLGFRKTADQLEYHRPLGTPERAR